jgi:hypothetical protein
MAQDHVLYGRSERGEPLFFSVVDCVGRDVKEVQFMLSRKQRHIAPQMDGFACTAARMSPMSFNWPDFPGHSGQRPSCLNKVLSFAVLIACLCLEILCLR